MVCARVSVSGGPLTLPPGPHPRRVLIAKGNDMAAKKKTAKKAKPAAKKTAAKRKKR